MATTPFQSRPPTDYPNISRVDGPPEWSAEDHRELRLSLFYLSAIRRFERWLLDHEGLVHGPLHSSIGQEAVAVGTVAALSPDDKITSTHRAHHHFLAKALAYYCPPDYDPLRDAHIPGQLAQCIERTLAEILGLKAGWQGGRGGSMHLYDRVSGNIGTTAIVGGGIPIASGAGFAEKVRGTGNVALAFFGDGASSIGAFHEGISLARAWGIPTIFVVENNLYSVATTVRETIGFDDIAIRSAGYDMPGIIVDGMDVLAVRSAIRDARAQAIEMAGPVFVEAKTYRFAHQVGALPGSAYEYRSKEEEGQWDARDPLIAFPTALISHEVVTAAEVDRIHQQADAMVQAAAAKFIVISGGKPSISPESWPVPATALEGALSDGREFAAITYTDPNEVVDRVELTYVTAMSRVIHRWMERNPDVFVVGEEVSHLKGGAYGATRDAIAAFPERVLSAPICELGFCGLALGAAMAGMRPIVELMFPDFALVAADQLFNHIAKARHMYGGFVPIPITVRTRTAQGRGYGPQHSSDPSGLFALFPGWRIVAPATPGDYVGLFNAAMICEDPVLIIEHHRLWQTKGPVPKDLDYVIPLGRASRVRKGSDVTVLTWSEPLLRCLRIAEEMALDEGIEVEIIDLRSLDEASFDRTTIAPSIEKTGAVVIVEDASWNQGVGVQISERISRELFDLLDFPVQRVAGKNVPTPVSRPLEEFVLLNDDDVRTALRSAARRIRD